MLRVYTGKSVYVTCDNIIRNTFLFLENFPTNCAIVLRRHLIAGVFFMFQKYAKIFFPILVKRTEKMDRIKQSSISEEDRKHIEKLRELVKDDLTPYYDTDFNLLRWLQGHNDDYEALVPKLKNHLQFRRSMWNLDTIADKPRNHSLHKYWKAGLTGPAVKTKNTLVNIEQTGRNDYWGMLMTYSISEILKARIHDLETMLRRVMQMEEETGEQASVMYIMDLTGLKYDRHLITLLTGALSSISSFMSDHYVEMIHTFVLVNAPSFIATVWTIAKPLLPERTRNKVRIYGSNWKEEIKNIALPDVLPKFWNNKGEEVFKADVELAQPLDPNGYYKGKMSEKSEVLSVGPGKTGFVEVTAEKGSKIHWCLQSDGHFAYTVYLIADGSDQMVNIYPHLAKVPGPTMVPIEDEIACEESGTYRFWFSNEHARWHTLTMQHMINVKKKSHDIV